MNKLRVVTRDHGKDEPTFTVWFEGTRAQCRRWILGRYGHFPPFAVVTKRTANFDRIVF